jgi:ribulose-phosphate 3-epimerase
MAISFYVIRKVFNTKLTKTIYYCIINEYRIMAIIAPSILAADFMHLAAAIEMCNQSNAEWIHLDVMDGRFVPNISFGLPIISQIRPITKKVLDVHLMIVEPEKYIADFKKAGADILTVHYEACIHLHRTIQQIKEMGMKAGVALNPHTPIHVLDDIITQIDVVCLMSVNPGFGGQKFIEHTYQKIAALKNLIIEKKATTLIEVDGGANVDNAAKLIRTGTDVLVAGNAVFANENPTAVINKMLGT